MGTSSSNFLETKIVTVTPTSGVHLQPPTTWAKKPLCIHCGYKGHTVDKCYKKHDYPIGYKPKGKQGGGSVNMRES